MMDDWEVAKSPNYETNKDKLYPYSEMPYQSEYKVVKIPHCINNLIEHVDYFGEGRAELPEGTLGFADCYNVKEEFCLVRFGSDEDRKIPNRIPLGHETGVGYTTRHYIKDNSVLTVTCAYTTSDKTCIQDIARIVNSDRGKVILYDYDDNVADVLADELKITKQLFYCPIYLLPENLQLTHRKSYRVYLNINELKRDLYKNVSKGDIEAAVILTGCLTSPYCCGAISDVVNKLLENNIGNVIVYAYKLWNNKYKDVVCQNFPPVVQHIFKGNCMVIINKHNNQVLALDPKTTSAQRDSRYKSSNKLGWKITPIWDEDNIKFKLYNVDTDMYLQLSSTVGENEVRHACDSRDSGETTDTFYFKPSIVNGQVAFTILNSEFGKKLELLTDHVDTSENNAAIGQEGAGNDQEGQTSGVMTNSNQEKQVDDDVRDIYYFD